MSGNVSIIGLGKFNLDVQVKEAQGFLVFEAGKVWIENPYLNFSCTNKSSIFNKLV